MAKNVSKSMVRVVYLPAEVTIDRVESHLHSYELFVSSPPPQHRVCPLP
jgi:hypothetical protein